MAKRICAFFFILLLSLSGGIAPAHAGFWKLLFPMLKQLEPDPALTLRAPFAQGANQASNAMGPQAPVALPENAIPLNQPHRSALQIADWLLVVTSESLTFEQKSILPEKYFNAAGFAQYQKFIAENGLQKAVESGDFVVRCYVKSKPVLLNEGAVAGTYHWLYEVPVMISVIRSTAKGYKNVTPTNRDMRLVVQVGRSITAQDPAGIVVESWNVAGAADKKSAP